MKTKLSIKQLAKDMSLKDKAKLLFADFHRQNETSGKERVLTREEERAITKDCQDKNQINGLNRLTQLFNLSQKAGIDLYVRLLELRNHIGKINTLVMTMYGRCMMEGLMIDLESLMEESSKKAAKKLETILEQNPLFMPDSFDLFRYVETSNEDYEMMPNLYFQTLFTRALKSQKRLQQVLHAIEYLDTKAGISLLSDWNYDYVDEAMSEIKEFSEKQGFIMAMNIYIGSYKKKDLTLDQEADVLFNQAIKDYDMAIQLTQEDVEIMEEMLERNLKRDPTP